MGKDKLKRFADVAQFSNCVEEPAVAFEDKKIDLAGKWRSDFFKNNNPVVLELACGGGEYTVGLAQLYPNVNFIGVDIKGNRLWKGAKIALENGLKNVGFLRTRIDFIDRCFDTNEVDEIWITFPDPQMQNNRKRKRLTHPVFINRYIEILKPEGKIRLKSDSTFLYLFTQTLCKEFNLKVEVDCADIYANLQQFPIELQNELNLKTYYEQKWLQMGKKIKYLQFQLPNSPLKNAKDFDVELERDKF